MGQRRQENHGGPAMTPLPSDWATLQQPAPRNHGRPAIDDLRPGQPLREVVGDFLADAAIARAEVGERDYGSKLTPNNGRDQAVDALQELADAAVYLAALFAEGESYGENYWVFRALKNLKLAAHAIRSASDFRAEVAAKRLAKGEVKS